MNGGQGSVSGSGLALVLLDPLGENHSLGDDEGHDVLLALDGLQNLQNVLLGGLEAWVGHVDQQDSLDLSVVLSDNELLGSGHLDLSELVFDLFLRGVGDVVENLGDLLLEVGWVSLSMVRAAGLLLEWRVSLMT